MNSVNKTLYIPLYGKAYVSRRGMFPDDKKAEEIWAAEGFPLRGKSRSKWLAFYMGIRAAVFDSWVRQRLAEAEDTVVLHIGCGMDSRVLRVDAGNHKWYDVDFPEVIAERRRYFAESGNYRMISGDIREAGWLSEISDRKQAVVVMEGVSMYVTPEALRTFIGNLGACFERVSLLMDCYSSLAAKLSKYKNPINDVGVTRVYGTDDPGSLENGAFAFVKEHEMTPQSFVDALHGAEKFIFRKLYAGGFAQKLYRLYEYRKR